MWTQPPEPSEAPRRIEVDERYIQEWVQFGMAEIDLRLTKEREFLKWCERNDRKDA